MFILFEIISVLYLTDYPVYGELLFKFFYIKYNII